MDPLSRRSTMAMGAEAETPDSRVYVPAQYVIQIALGGQDGASQGGRVTLRPEDFILKRITFATNADTPYFHPNIALPGYSIHGRSVAISWSDEFTQFMDQDALVSAIFGDSQGFLDLPRPIYFQGKQTLSVKLTRLFWPEVVEPEERQITRWDFVFHGLGVLPPGRHASGSI